MKYFFSLQVTSPGAKLGPLRKCMLVEAPHVMAALDAARARLVVEGLRFYKLVYVSHTQGKDMDAVVLPIWRGLIDDIDYLRTASHTKTVEVLACHYNDGEIEELLDTAIGIEQAIRENSDRQRD